MHYKFDVCFDGKSFVIQSASLVRIVFQDLDRAKSERISLTFDSLTHDSMSEMSTSFTSITNL